MSSLIENAVVKLDKLTRDCVFLVLSARMNKTIKFRLLYRIMCNKFYKICNCFRNKFSFAAEALIEALLTNHVGKIEM